METGFPAHHHASAHLGERAGQRLGDQLGDACGTWGFQAQHVEGH
jgi:hypothetical protein